MRPKLLRFFRLLLLTILIFSLVSACRGNSSQQPIQTNDTSLEAVQVVEHAGGKTNVPLNPQRVVVLGGGIDPVMSLGVKPVGSARADGQYLKNRLEGVKNVGSYDSPNLEAIAALKPDLILGTYPSSQSIYKLLSQIAPTVLAEVQTGSEWKKTLNVYAQALGKTDQAGQIMANYHARIEKFQAQMGDRLQKTEVSIVNVRQDRIRIYLEDSFSGKVVTDAGLPRPPDQANPEDQFDPEYPFAMDISREVLQKADGDVIFVWTYGGSDNHSQEAKTALKQLKADPLWLQLNAVQQNDVYKVPSYWIGIGPIAANLVLDDLFKYLIE